jgi:hypothetical protein
MDRAAYGVNLVCLVVGFLCAALVLRGGQAPECSALVRAPPAQAQSPHQVALPGGGGGGDEAQALRAEVAMLRRALVSIYCELRGVGPTGGFCLDAKNSGHAGGNDILPRELAVQLAALFDGARVANLGAGIGHYELFWAATPLGQPAPAAVRSCDGAENIAEFALRHPVTAEPLVTYCDLTAPGLSLGEADWAMSIEVAEHIPAGTSEKAFLDNLVAHGRKGIVLSWAVPGQGGHHHVNEKANADVVALVVARGYVSDAETTARLRGVVDDGAFWLKNTIHVFRKA